jgi:hypothetical protein
MPDEYAFATPEDVAARRVATFTDEDTATAAFLVNAATAVIVDAAGKTDDWALALDPVPRILKYLCVEVAARAMANPDSVRSVSEQLGAYQESVSFRDAAVGGGLLLTSVEELLVRRAVYGRTSGSVRVASVVDDLLECEGS